MLCLGIVTAQQKCYRERKFLFANGMDPSSARPPGVRYPPPPLVPGPLSKRISFSRGFLLSGCVKVDSLAGKAI